MTPEWIVARALTNELDSPRGPVMESDRVLARAALRALEEAGYAVVPREPTEAMLAAYQHAFVSEKRFEGAEVFRAMLDAAVTSPPD